MHRDDDEDKRLADKESIGVDHEARRQASEARLVADRADLKADNLGKRLDRIDDDIKEGFKQVRESVTRVHGRIDDLNNKGDTRFNRLLLSIAGVALMIITNIILRKVGLL